VLLCCFYKHNQFSLKKSLPDIIKNFTKVDSKRIV